MLVYVVLVPGDFEALLFGHIVRVVVVIDLKLARPHGIDDLCQRQIGSDWGRFENVVDVVVSLKGTALPGDFCAQSLERMRSACANPTE